MIILVNPCKTWLRSLYEMLARNEFDLLWKYENTLPCNKNFMTTKTSLDTFIGEREPEQILSRFMQ